MSRTERRRARRIVPDASSGAQLGIRLRTGHELRVLDIGSVGVRVDGPGRLLPGRHVDIRVATPRGVVPVKALVVRSRVSAITVNVLTYESALSFERPVILAPSEVA